MKLHIYDVDGNILRTLMLEQESTDPKDPASQLYNVTTEDRIYEVELDGYDVLFQKADEEGRV